MRDLSGRNLSCLVLLLAAALFATAIPSVAAEKVPLAIEGYDPVAYFAIGKPTRGLPEFEFEWDEHRYRFVRAEHRDLFKADPVRYAPQFANFCAMSLSRGVLVVADPENWLISDGRLYIFGAAYGPDRFSKDLGANVAKADQNRPLIEKK
jgi:hypothetical protein